ncbi:MAG: DUF1761 domain-containing protein [Bacteroidales bacterium]|nr:DUF1761 domain-containing protein [Bacteroidales bacterium]
MINLTDLNYLAVAVAAIASFALGSLWYSPLLFSKTWQKELGFTDEYIREANMGKIFGTSFILFIAASLGVALFFQIIGTNKIDWLLGMLYGFLIGVAFVSTTMGINMLYQRRSFKLWAIDAFYQIICFCIMGLIISVW